MGSIPVGVTTWEHSSAGRASALQAEGHRFEPCCSHQQKHIARAVFFCCQTARTYGRFATTRTARCAPRVTADAPFLSQATSLSLFYEPCSPTNKNTSQERCFFVAKTARTYGRFGRYKEREKNYRIEKTAVSTAVFRLNLHFTIIVDIYI